MQKWWDGMGFGKLGTQMSLLRCPLNLGQWRWISKISFAGNLYLPGKDYYDPPHYPDHPDMRESDPYLERPPLPRNLNNFRAQVIHSIFHHNHHHHDHQHNDSRRRRTGCTTTRRTPGWQCSRTQTSSQSCWQGSFWLIFPPQFCHVILINSCPSNLPFGHWRNINLKQ